MREVKIIFVVLCSYLIILSIGIFSPAIFQSIFTAPIEAFQSIKQQIALGNAPYHASFFTPETSDKKGVVINDTENSYNGYTFFTSADKVGATLIDQNGNEIHSWSKPAAEIWPDKAAVQSIPANLHTTTRGFLNPTDGSVFLIYTALGMIPGNHFGMVKLDKNSNVEWTYDGYAHHDLDVMPNGQIYVLGYDVAGDISEDFPNIKGPVLDCTLIVLDENGKEIKTLSFLDLFAASDLKVILEHISKTPTDPAMPIGDILHANTIEPVPQTAIDTAPMLTPNTVMISFRNLDLLVMVDVEREKITWASYGPWKGQHHTEIQDDGSVIMFDNMGHLGEGGASRILQTNLNDLSTVWEYAGTQKRPFFSAYNSMVDPLPNGNILATESSTGRIFEVTRDKNIVWEYWMPHRIQSEAGENLTPSIFSAKRYKAGDLKFLK